MKRIIKFRAKAISGESEGKFVYGDLVHDCDRKPFISVSGYSVQGTGFSISNAVDPDTVGQFTGLIDKKGNAIYEVDIVVWTDSDNNRRQDVVKWINGGLCLCNSQYTVGSYGELEVIGNIHDNPELLKGGNE